MISNDVTGWLQVASEITEKLRADICDCRLLDHPDGIDADMELVLSCQAIVDVCERYRRDHSESPAQRREDARADAYSKRSSDT